MMLVLRGAMRSINVALGFVACNFSDQAIFSLLLQGQK